MEKHVRVGIRELRQNLSVYVREVRERGRSYEVTEHGRPVARLTPLTDTPTSTIDRMIAEGRATRAKRDIASLAPPAPARTGTPVSQILQEMRDRERW